MYERSYEKKTLNQRLVKLKGFMLKVLMEQKSGSWLVGTTLSSI